MKTRDIVSCGMLIGVAMLAGYIEQTFPINMAVPGIKLGLANSATIIALSVLGKKEAILITELRIILTTFMFGKLFAMIFSITGSVLSLLVMLLLKKTNKFSNVGISVSGAVMHNVGQIIAAALLLHTKAIIYYLPVLFLSGIIAGIIIGIISQIIIDRVNVFQNRSSE